MIESTVRQDLEAYRDEFRLVQNSIGGSCGNGLCFTGEAIVTLDQLGLINNTDRVDLLTSVTLCETMPGSGCLRRHPTSWREQNGPDDYYGVAVACIVLGRQDIAARILKHGRENRYRFFGPLTLPYYYRDELPYVSDDARAWLGRQIGLIGLLRQGAGEGMPWLAKKALQWSLKNTDRQGPPSHGSGGQDKWRINHMVAHVAKKLPGSDWKDAVDHFERDLAAQFPDGMAQVYREYFGGEHWLSKYSRIAETKGIL